MLLVRWRKWLPNNALRPLATVANTDSKCPILQVVIATAFEVRWRYFLAFDILHPFRNAPVRKPR